MKKQLFLILLCCSILSTCFMGCGTKIKATNLLKNIKSIPTVEPSQIAEKDTIIATNFAVRLFQNAKSGEENTLISPLSILPALSMTANGADGDTRMQIEKSFGLSIEKLNTCMHSYIKNLPKENNCKFHLANSIWFRNTKDFSIQDAFLKKTAAYYDAAIYEASFDETTLADINAWVAEQTEDLIPSMLDEIDPNAYLYLINALSFDSKWSSIYDASSIKDDSFTREDGSTHDVQMMYSTEYEYLEDEYATGFFKPYSGYSYAFVALLPKEGVSLTDYVDTLTGEHLHQILTNRMEYPVSASIPKFNSEFRIDLCTPLQQLGIKDAFDQERADFSNICSSQKERLFINRILHKSCLSVDEAGTKAGSSTSIGMEKTASSASNGEEKKVYLNRPFLYMVVDYEHNFPIFIGTADDIQ